MAIIKIATTYFLNSDFVFITHTTYLTRNARGNTVFFFQSNMSRRKKGFTFNAEKVLERDEAFYQERASNICEKKFICCHKGELFQL